MKATHRPPNTLVKSEFWISVFVTTYIFLIVLWLIRDSNPMVHRVVNVFAPVIRVLGLEQNWALFSPDLRKFNLHNLSIVTFRDGSFKLYEWPRMERSNLIEKAQNEKFRKMFNDCMPWQTYADFRPSVARYIARANANPGNPPVQVALAYFFGAIPGPEVGVTQENLPEQSKFYCYYLYQVEAGDLP
jgi:hypothetical protein